MRQSFNRAMLKLVNEVIAVSNTPYVAGGSEQLHRRLAGLHGHGRVGVHEVVVDGAYHLIEDHDRRLGHDHLPQPEVDPLPLYRVRDILLLCYGEFTGM